MTIKPLGAGQEVGRSCVLLKFKGKQIMVGFDASVLVVSAKARARTPIPSCHSSIRNVLCMCTGSLRWTAVYIRGLVA